MTVLLALAATLAPQAAVSADDLADAKCAAAMITVSEQMTDPTEKANVGGMMMFYFGKIVGRSGTAAVKPALGAAAAVIDAGAMPTLAESCAKEGEQAMNEL